MSVAEKRISVDELKNQLELLSKTEITLVPGQFYYLFGKPGTTYTLQATNNDSELNAIVYAILCTIDNNNSWLFNHVQLETFGSKGHIFQMDQAEYVFVYNGSSREYHPNPEVTFRLKEQNH